MDELRKGIAIGMLFGSGSGGHGNLMTKTATENGTYTAAEEIDPETGEIFDPPKDGYSVFTVDLALDDKSVSLTTSQITGSQTAVFEYDPHSENPELEGYSLFTVDLSGVKNDVEDLQQSIADAETCRQQVIAALQRYDPDYDPAEGECPSDKVDEVVDEVGELEDELEQCHDCKDAVVAAIQQYVPSFTPDPTTCNIPDGVDDVYQQGREDEATENPPGYKLPAGTDPSDPNIQTIVAGNPLTDNTTGVTIGTETYQNPDNSWGIKPYYAIDGVKTYMSGVSGDTATRVISITDIVLKVTDPTTGDWEGSALVTWDHPWWTPTTFTYNGRDYHLIGYGSTSDTYTVRNS